MVNGLSAIADFAIVRSMNVNAVLGGKVAVIEVIDALKSGR